MDVPEGRAVPEDPGAVPAAARLLRDLVNTFEPQTGDERLTDPAALAGWCTGRGLLDAGTPVTPADVVLVVAVREGLRGVLQAHAGHAAPPDALDALDAALAAVPLRASIRPSGDLVLRARGDEAGAVVVGRLLDAVRHADADGSWARLKVCARDSCRWAFYDTSRNRSGRWCSMAGCGNVVKMRRAHARRREAAPVAGA
jgi:predicted RNA-binding Zn ribbon-like protein